jgi:hypothetical protein
MGSAGVDIDMYTEVLVLLIFLAIMTFILSAIEKD